ncbi:Hypothetical predicted protein, partial [Pelobates cultripes]
EFSEMSLGKKRSGFQITSVTSDYQPLSPVSPISAEHSLSPTPNGPCSPPTSRFRVVRLDHDPVAGGRRYQRGRAGGKGQQAPRSQGAPVLGVTEKDTVIQITPPASQPQSGLPSPAPTTPSDSHPKRPISDVFNERLILARSVFGLGEDSEHDSSSSNNLIAIDNKIEQAMVSVKTFTLSLHRYPLPPLFLYFFTTPLTSNAVCYSSTASLHR